MSLFAALFFLLGIENIFAFQPLLGGSLSWAVNSRFGYGDRVVNLSLTSAFLAYPNCTYELGDQVVCSSQNNENVLLAETHGLLCFEQLKRDFRPSNFSFDCTRVLDTSSGGSSPYGTVNRFITIDKLYVGLDSVVVGRLAISVRIAEDATGLLAWFLPINAPSALLPTCVNSSAGPCSISKLTPASLSLESYWTDFRFGPTNISSAAPDSQAPLFLSYVPLCSVNSTHRTHCAVPNLHSPVALFPPIFSVPRAGPADPDPSSSPLPSFPFKAFDADGHAMTQLVPPAALRAPCFLGSDAADPPAPAWPAAVCEGGALRGAPCANDAACGGGGRCTAPPSGCRAFRDADLDSDAAAATGNRLRFNFSFDAPPFDSPTVAPLLRAAGTAGVLPLPRLSQHAVYTVDDPRAAAPGAPPGNASLPSWRDGGAAALALFSAYPSDCGPAGRPPAFVTGPGSWDRAVPTEIACAWGRACEAALYARAPPAPPGAAAVRVEFAAGFRPAAGGARLRRADGAECVGTGAVACILTLGASLTDSDAAWRPGAARIECFVAVASAQASEGSGGATGCSSLPLCVKIRVGDALPHAGGFLPQLGTPTVTVAVGTAGGVAGGALEVNVSWAALPAGGAAAYGRFKEYVIECAVDGGAYFEAAAGLDPGRSAAVLHETSFARSGGGGVGREYTFRVAALFKDGISPQRRYRSAASRPVRVLPGLARNGTVLAWAWHGRVLSLHRLAPDGAATSLGSFISGPVGPKAVVTDSARGRLIALLADGDTGAGGDDGGPELLVVRASDGAAAARGRVSVQSGAVLWNLEWDEASESVIAVCLNASLAMLVAIPVPPPLAADGPNAPGLDSAPLRLDVLAALPCQPPAPFGCQVRFAVSAYDRAGRVYFYVDADTGGVMAFALESRVFAGPISVAKAGEQVLGLAYDGVRCALLVFAGAWPGPGGVSLTRVGYRGQEFWRQGAVEIRAVPTPLGAVPPRFGSLACDLVQESCMLLSARGGVVRYDMGVNATSALLVDPPLHLVGLAMLADRRPVVRAVVPSALHADAPEITVVGMNFGPSPTDIRVRVADTWCNESSWRSDSVLVCSVPRAQVVFDGVPMGLTIRHGQQELILPRAITVVVETWSKVVPTSFSTLSFGTNVTFSGTGFKSADTYRCLFVSNSSIALCAAPIQATDKSLSFMLPLWLAVAEPVQVLLLHGQSLMGEFRPRTVAGRFVTEFTESWAELQPACANLSSGSKSITIYGLGFNSSRLSSYRCNFRLNGNLSAAKVSFRELVCEIPGFGTRNTWLKSGGLDFMTVSNLEANIDLYNSACCLDDSVCVCSDGRDFLFTAGWISVMPTVGLIGSSISLRVQGFAFDMTASYRCSFSGINDAASDWTAKGFVQDSSTIVCNMTNIRARRGLYQLHLNAAESNNISRSEMCCTSTDALTSCQTTGVSGPFVVFDVLSWFQSPSMTNLSSAGHDTITISGLGFDSARRYVCSYVASEFSVVESASSFSVYDEIHCPVPVWPYSASMVKLQIIFADQARDSVAPEAEFSVQFVHIVTRIVPNKFYSLSSGVVQVWGAGFKMTEQRYICSFSNLITGEESTRVNGMLVNNSLILCENLATDLTTVQFRVCFLSFQSNLEPLWSSNLTVVFGWVALHPAEITAQGGMVTVVGSNFTGSANNFSLTVCLTNNQTCIWKYITAVFDVVSDSEVVFSLPRWEGAATAVGAAKVTLYYKGNEVPFEGYSQHDLQGRGEILIKQYAVALEPGFACSYGNQTIHIKGYGFFEEPELYHLLFEDINGKSGKSGSCRVLNQTYMQCPTLAWYIAAHGSAGLIFSCHSHHEDIGLCGANTTIVVQKFHFSFTACILRIFPTLAGAATPQMLSIEGAGFMKQPSTVSKCIFILNTQAWTETAATIINFTHATCSSPSWPFQSGVLRVQMRINDTWIDAFDKTIILQIFTEIVNLFPSLGAGAGRHVTITGAGFYSQYSVSSVEHQYLCSVTGGSNSSAVKPISASTLSCTLPVWPGGSRNVSILIIDITEDLPVWGQLNFLYGSGMISLSLSRGPATGGNKVFIRGEDFKSDIQYKAIIGDDNITVNVSFINKTHMWIIMPVWNRGGMEVTVILADGPSLLVDFGILTYVYHEILLLRMPAFGSAYGSFLTVKGLGFRSGRNYKCKFTSKVNPGQWIESKPTSPKRLSSSEIEFSIPRWTYASGQVNITIYDENVQIIAADCSDFTFEIRAVWAEAQFNQKNLFIGGDKITIQGAGFDPSMNYTCKFRQCRLIGQPCNFADSSDESLPCHADSCLRGPNKAEDPSKLICFIPAWLHQSKSAFLSIFRGENMVQQVFTSAYKANFYGLPLIQSANSSMNARFSGNTLLNISGSNFALVDLTQGARIGGSACASTGWLSNTQIHSRTPKASGIDFGKPLVVSVHLYLIGTLSGAFTYDGPKLDVLQGRNIENSSLKTLPITTLRNSPSMSNNGLNLSEVAGLFAVPDLTSRLRIGITAAISTFWISSSVVRCQVASGGGFDYPSTVTVDQAVATRPLSFSYDRPSSNNHSIANAPRRSLRLLNLNVRTTENTSHQYGRNFGNVGFSPSLKGLDTCAESTQWKSDSSIRGQISLRTFGSQPSVVTVSLMLGSVSEGWSFDVLNPSNLGTSLLKTNSALHSVVGIAMGRNIMILSSLVGSVGRTSCERTEWTSDSTILALLPSGLGSSLKISLTSGLLVGSFSQSNSYDRPSIMFSHSEIDEGLQMQGIPFSAFGVGQYIGTNVCTNFMQNDCDWRLSSISDAWTFCYKDVTCECQNASYSVTQDETCSMLRHSSMWETVIKRRGLKAPSADVRGSSLIYFRQNPRFSFYSGWTDYFAEFQFILFSGHKSRDQWFGIYFEYIDDSNFYRLEINVVLQVVRVRKHENGVLTNVWVCKSGPSFAFGTLFSVRVHILGSSVSIFWMEVLVDSSGSYLQLQPSSFFQPYHCEIKLSSGTGQNMKSSVGFFASGLGEVYLMNLHVYMNYVMAKHSNVLIPKTTSLTLLGASFSVNSVSEMARNMLSSCETTVWFSDTMILCKAAEPTGGSLKFMATVGALAGTVTEAITCDVPMVSVSNPPNVPPTALEFRTVSYVSHLGPKLGSVAGAIGFTADEATVWLSNTAIQSKVGFTLAATNKITISAGIRVGSLTQVLSHDAGYVLSLLNINSGTTGSASVTLRGGSLGTSRHSGKASGGRSACEVTCWISDSAVACSLSGGKAASALLVMTTGIRVGSSKTVLSFDSGAVSTSRAANQACLVSVVVAVLGSGAGPSAFSGSLRAGVSGAERTDWSSDSSLAARTAAGASRSLRAVISSGRRAASLSRTLSYDAFSAIPRAQNVPQLLPLISVEFTTNVSVSHLGPKLGSVTSAIGFTADEATVWLSDTAIQSKVGATLAATNQVVLSAGVRVGSLTQVLTHDDSYLQSVVVKSNAAATGSASVTLRGGSLGTSRHSGKASGGRSACEVTGWISDSAVACSLSGGKATSALLVMTTGIRVGSSKTMMSFDSGAVSTTRAANQAGFVSAGMAVLGSGAGPSAFSGTLRAGASGAERTDWSSDSSLAAARTAAGASRSLRAVISSGRRAASLSTALTYDIPPIRSIAVSSRNVSGVVRTGSASVTGKNLGTVRSSVMSRSGGSAAERTAWVSDSSLILVVPSGAGMALRFSITVLSAVGTAIQSLTYIAPAVSGNGSVSLRTLTGGSWCATEYGLCNCSGVVRYTALDGKGSSAASPSSLVCTSPSPFTDPSPDTIKSCYCFNLPFVGGEVVTVAGSGFGDHDFTPRAILSAATNSSTKWMSESSIVCTLPPCTLSNCVTAAAAGLQSVVVSVAKQPSIAALSPFSYVINELNLCPHFWASSGTQTLAARSGLLCRSNYSNDESLVWLIDTCQSAGGKCSNFDKVGNASYVWQTVLSFSTFSSQSGLDRLSVLSCSNSSCSQSWTKLDAYSGHVLPGFVTGNPYLKVIWSTDSNTTFSGWNATWNSSYKTKFQFFNDPVDYDDAVSQCKLLSDSEPGIWSLASVLLDVENKAVQSLLPTGGATTSWIGLKYNGSALIWSDGAPYGDYQNWDLNFPTIDSSYCTVMDASTLLWKSENCSNKNRFVCSRK